MWAGPGCPRDRCVVRRLATQRGPALGRGVERTMGGELDGVAGPEWSGVTRSPRPCRRRRFDARFRRSVRRGAGADRRCCVEASTARCVANRRCRAAPRRGGWWRRTERSPAGCRPATWRPWEAATRPPRRLRPAVAELLELGGTFEPAEEERELVEEPFSGGRAGNWWPSIWDQSVSSAAMSGESMKSAAVGTPMFLAAHFSSRASRMTSG